MNFPSSNLLFPMVTIKFLSFCLILLHPICDVIQGFSLKITVNNFRKRFCTVMFIFSVMATVLSFWKPAVNAFALMLLVIPTIYLLYHELSLIKHQDIRVYRLGVRTVTILIVAVICWLNDRLFCEFYSSIKFPYLHGFWHILIFLASYTICVLFAYFFVKDELPERNPVLKYWPWNHFELGIPYVSIKAPKSLRDQI